jgi:hypothetical protein
MKLSFREYNSKDLKEFLQYLFNNKQDILDMKKSAIKITDSFSSNVIVNDVDAQKNYLFSNDAEKGILKRTIVANTYNWLDSHNDVHVDSIFSKSIKERSSRIPHLHDHKLELGAKVGKIISIAEKNIEWRNLGVDVKGATTVLMIESEIKKSYNEKIFNAYLNDEINQHSVGMRYIKIDLALNDDDYKDEFKVWNTYFDRVGNKNKAEQQGFFFAVKEAALIEVSAVLIGSNEITPVLGNKFEPLKNIQTGESLKDTPQKIFDVEKLLTYYKI